MARVVRSPHLNLRIRRRTTSELPAAWWAGVENCLNDLSGKCALGSIEGIAVDGTSGTLVALDAGNAPLGAASLYNDTCDDPAIVAAIAVAAPATSPALGATTPWAAPSSFRGAAASTASSTRLIGLRCGSAKATPFQTRTMP